MVDLYFVQQEQPGGRGRPDETYTLVPNGTRWHDHVRGDGCSYSGEWHPPLYGFVDRDTAREMFRRVRVAIRTEQVCPCSVHGNLSGQPPAIGDAGRR